MQFSSGAVGRAPAAVPVISPDGRTVAFTTMDRSGKRQLWVRPIDSLTAQPLPGTDGAGWPFWSPDSRSPRLFCRRQADEGRGRRAALR